MHSSRSSEATELSAPSALSRVRVRVKTNCIPIVLSVHFSNHEKPRQWHQNYRADILYTRGIKDRSGNASFKVALSGFHISADVPHLKVHVCVLKQ